MIFSTASKIRVVEGGAPLPGPGGLQSDSLSHPPQINDFCDLLGTPYAPVSKIAPVNC